MTLLNDLRLDIGDDDGVIPSGIVPVPTSGLPVGANTTLLSDLRVDIGDDDGVIPSGSLADGIPIHDLLSLQHGDTTPASPSNGHLILSNNTTWFAFPSGIEGTRLAVISGAVQWAPLPPGVDVSGAIAIHAAISDAHHARYTDAEAILASSGALDHHQKYTDAEASGVAVQVVVTGIAEHSAISSAHHTRYTDTEAIAASSGALDHHLRYTDSEASGIAVQVATTGILEHTAISGAHHPRYTNEEAANVAASVLATGISVAIIQESGVELIANATTTAVQPTFSTLLSSSINLINPSGNLRIMATAAINANAAVPALFHLYINGVFYRATTINVSGSIDNASIVIPRVAVTGINPHTVSLRWAKFNQPLVTLRCLPSTLPDFYHASLSVQEVN